MSDGSRPGIGGLPPKYRVYDIDLLVYDSTGQVVTSWQDVQEVWLDPPNIAARRTRYYDEGGPVVYEDRGTFNADFSVSGVDGFRGDVVRPPVPRGWCSLHRRTRRPSRLLDDELDRIRHRGTLPSCSGCEDTASIFSREELYPGRYFIRTRDHLLSKSDDVPDAMTKPAGASS